MSLYAEAQLLIENTFLQAWGVITPIDLDNVKFTPVRGQSFVRLQIEWVDKKQISIGRMKRAEGFILVSVFIPSETGTVHAMDMADAVCNILEDWNQGRIETRTGKIQRIGNVKNWYQVNVVIPLFYTNCKR